MKRIEMVELIMLILRGCYPQYLDNQSNYSVRIDADYVLQELEYAGMLPPVLPDWQPYKMVNNRFIPTLGSGNYWEPEDE